MKILVVRRKMYTNRKIRKEMQLIVRNSLKYFETKCETPPTYAQCKITHVTARMSGKCSAVELMKRRH